MLVGIVIMMAVLGMPLMLSNPMHHEMGCPFMSGQAAFCATSLLEHIKHWQMAFGTILTELLLAAVLALIVLREWRAAGLREPSIARVRMRSREPDRPTLLQELFSQGILNRKEHYRF